MRPTRIFCRALLVVLLLAGCGRVEDSAVPLIHSYSAQPTPIPTSTPDSIELTKEAFTDVVNTRDAIFQAGGSLPTATGPVPSHVTAFQTEAALGYSPTPRPLYPEGLELDCDRTDITYRHGNCWNTNHNNVSYFMVVGSLNRDLAQGVISLRLDGPNITLAEQRSVDYLTPQKVGMIEVESAAWPYVTVRTQAEPRTRFTFNLETRQWKDGTTPAPIDPADPLQIKATIAVEETQAVQTALAGTPPPIEPASTAKPTVWPPPTPYFANVTPLAGGGRIIDVPNTVIGRDFTTLNSWAILPTVDTVLMVKAGGDYPTGNQVELVQGVLIIEKYDNGDEGQLLQQDYYATPLKTGQARVVDALVRGTTMNVLITTENGSTWWFDVSNRQWLTDGATNVPTALPPAATATPTVTPIGQ